VRSRDTAAFRKTIDKCTHSVALDEAAGFPDELERRPARMLRSFEPTELKAQFRELALQLMARVTSGKPGAV
jgi:hypothetical protein